jgi:arylsulfatase A-like enzyme
MQKLTFSLSQRLSLLLAGLLVTGLTAIGTRPNVAAEPAKRPNILFIFADDQSYKTIGCYGAAPEWVRTPNIDKLAAAGVRFERAYLGAWCMPSRASLLTGRLQHAVMSMSMAGSYPGSTYDPQQCPFIPAQFRKQGYQTAQIGKWHTGTDAGFGRDWDYQIVWNRPAHPENAGNYYRDQLLTFNGEDRLTKGYSTDNYTDWAVEYIRGQNRVADKPWYLWLCYGAIHGPTTPAERHRGSLAGKTTRPPSDILGPWPNKPKYLENTAAWVRGEDGKPYMAKKKGGEVIFDANSPGKSFDDWIQQVNECNAAVDEGVGRVIKALADSGQLENTLIVYSADQGFGLGEHGFTQKVAPYDATIASPLILHWPGKIPAGKLCRHPVNSPDLVDYLCRQAGVTIPWKTHGRDIRPLVENPETTEWRSPVLLTHTSRNYGAETDSIPTDERLTSTSGVPWYTMLRDGKYKYIRNLLAGEIEEVYNLEADPEELVNLASSPVNASLLAELRTKAIAELRRTDAKFVDQLPPTRAEMAARNATDAPREVAQPLLYTVPFKGGDGQYLIYRIPAIWTGPSSPVRRTFSPSPPDVRRTSSPSLPIVRRTSSPSPEPQLAADRSPTQSQPILAFAEGRKAQRRAAGDIDIVLRRSWDGGQTWAPQQVIVDLGTDFCGNPCVTFDPTTNRLWLAFTRSPGEATEECIVSRQAAPTTVWVTSSDDEGATWSTPRDISATTRRDSWGWYGTGPGAGLFLRSAAGGRLLIPAYHTEDGVYRAHCFYSDDQGATWQLGDVAADNASEPQIVQLADHSLLMNARTIAGKGEQRTLVVSRDRGHSWQPAQGKTALVDNHCQGCLFRCYRSGTKDQFDLIYTQPITRGRVGVHAWLSDDEGVSWPTAQNLWRGPSAYTAMVRSHDGQICLLLECGRKDVYEQIAFLKFPSEWLRTRKAAEAAMKP